MNLEEGINRLSQLFMSANACMDRQDYRAAINEYNKIIELVQTLRKPFDNGEVPLNIINVVFPKILESEKAAKNGISVAQLGIEAQKKSAENQSAVNTAQPEIISIDDISNPDVKQYTQHMAAAINHLENGDYNSAINEYKRALDNICNLTILITELTNNYPTDLAIKTMKKLSDAELEVHKGLFSAYVKKGDLAGAAVIQKNIDNLMNPPPVEDLLPPQNQNPVPTQNQYNAQSNSYNSQASGCFSTICFIFVILAGLIFY